VKNEKCKMKNEKLEMSRNDHQDLADRLMEFAARVGRVVDALPASRLGRHVAGQLIRSGTSPAPNYVEACAAESRKDFIHKLGIRLKELSESRCWIQLIIKSHTGSPRPSLARRAAAWRCDTGAQTYSQFLSH
jgi:four helix bundle protein